VRFYFVPVLKYCTHLVSFCLAVKCRVDQLKTELNQVSRWFNDVEKNMRSGFAAGIFHIESRKLKQYLSPKVEVALNQLKDLLLKTFSKKCAEYDIICIAASTIKLCFLLLISVRLFVVFQTVFFLSRYQVGARILRKAQASQQHSRAAQGFRRLCREGEGNQN
jgi:hypothetical protein